MQLVQIVYIRVSKIIIIQKKKLYQGVIQGKGGISPQLQSPPPPFQL